jgi:hypothetical protein
MVGVGFVKVKVVTVIFDFLPLGSHLHQV